jgi:hypothetical protein
VVAWVSVCVWLLAALLAILLAFRGPPWTSSPLETVAIVGFIVGGALAIFGFPAMFRQAHREIAAGYSTVIGSWVRGSTPLVNRRTRRIEGGSTDRFDAVAARARAPWASPADRGSQPPTARTSLVGPQLNFVRTITRSTAISSTVLAAMAIWARSRNGTPSALGTLTTGGIVLGGLLVVTLTAAFIVRAIQASQSSEVSRLADGIVLACYITPQARASQERLGLRKGLIPRFPVLVFDGDGFSIWSTSGIPRPVITITRRDVLSLDATRVFSGWTSAPGLEIDVVPPDERLPFVMEFTIFDPSRMLTAANEQKIDALIASITAVWSH